MTVWVNKAGAVPAYEGRLCMVTSRTGRGGGFPKGQIDPGHTPGEAALVEAWEEAGLVGTLDPEPVGNYVYEKFSLPHHVLVYRMRVVEVRDDWPERGQRERAWVTLAEAVERSEEPTLRELLVRAFGAGLTLATA